MARRAKACCQAGAKGGGPRSGGRCGTRCLGAERVASRRTLGAPAGRLRGAQGNPSRGDGPAAWPGHG